MIVVKDLCRRKQVLTDEQVQELREAHERNPAKSYKELAAERGIHWKTAYKVCTGRHRTKCQGPIDKTTVLPEVARCGKCGTTGVVPCRTCMSVCTKLHEFLCDVLIEADLVFDELDDSPERPPCDPSPISIAAMCHAIRRANPRDVTQDHSLALCLN